MKIGIIGTGNMGTNLARLWKESGHDIHFSFSRDQAKLRTKAAEFGATSGSVREAVENCDVLLLSVPWSAVSEAIAQAGDLTGKILITCCTPLTDDLFGLTMGTNTSGAETIQAMAPGVRLVEAFNTVFASILEAGERNFGDHPATVFYCGDDEEAKKVVAPLIEETGCSALDAGPLSSARFIEPMGVMVLRFAFMLGQGMNLNLALLRR